ncbi:PREDICTED: sprouty-related, EVH1 domain-containing protein 2-like [Cyprinodon variegatus]|uniref:sprouty-related, EVH1 domain-containing protein 2-like n=1 Tax=Cyprinodon variegatus TaxID=28743 RepID=UPI000742AD49|nr:PREDICTED: sprouty-related, EVH1 domain-containing protein 2-like [Cyprinodon variegatus]
MVRVKAVVMTRDESSGGWLAQDGCLSRVGVCRLLPNELQGRNRFLIHGERLKDRQVILECFLKKDLVYTKATPTFHHWKVDNKKCGLTFQCSSDARAFDRGVRRALEDLAEGLQQREGTRRVQRLVVGRGLSNGRARLQTYQCSGPEFLPILFLRAGRQSLHWTSSLPNTAYNLVGLTIVMTNCWLYSALGQAVFLLQTICIVSSPPFLLQTATDSSSNSSQRREPTMHVLAPANFCEPRRHHCILGHFYEHHRPSDHYFLDPAVHIFPRHANFPLEEEEIVRISPHERTWLTGYEDYRHANSTRDKLMQPHIPDTCVHFTKSEPPKHNYTYPYPLSCGVQRGYDSKPGCLEMGGGRRAVVTLQPRPPQSKGKCRMEDGERFRCVYCQDMFNREENGRGQCQEAPDPIQTCIRRVSFMWCADSLLYHCMSDPEGDYSDPCSCDTSDERFCLRWTALIGLSLVAPCMCCYAPLRACHRCGVACRCCGGKHRAVGRSFWTSRWRSHDFLVNTRTHSPL